jgi:hypothetical protein
VALQVAIAVAVLAVLAVLPGSYRAYTAGFFTAAIIAISAFAVLQLSGSAARLMGALAEQWTAADLRPMQKSGWRLVNGLRLRPWDIDHLLAGPGGVFAVETKWQSSPWRLHQPESRIRDAAEQAANNAADLRKWVSTTRARITQVTPVVVLWGSFPKDAELAPFHEPRTGVLVIPGRCLTTWRRGLLDDPKRLLEAEQLDQYWQALSEQVARTDAHDGPAPIGPRRIALQTGAALAGFVAAVYTAGAATHLPGGDPAVLTAVAAMVIAGTMIAVRSPRYRPPAAGWLTGVGALIVGTVLILSR